ncbi:MAG: GspE/PulE family protein, partial [Fimbriimonadaceae bacterium]
DGLDVLRNLTGRRIEPCFALPEPLARAIEASSGYLAECETLDAFVQQAISEMKPDVARQENRIAEIESRPVVSVVNRILADAIRMGASDVHIEPHHDRVEVRYRQDGQMVKVRELPLGMMPMLATRIKIMSELDIVETRLPQDGRVTVEIDARSVDLRVSVVPNKHGPRIVLRILDRSISLRPLESLGFRIDNLALFRNMIRRPHGLVLVTGPTGSGKTTTLYAALDELRSETTNIMTCEDPIEYDIDGISQAQINEKVGLTFAKLLRAALRQDPDVILVGEIRDAETAETAIRASLTGHLVLSTLHCNTAISAVPRLLDMGVDPYLLSTCLVGVTAQRLVRRLCPRCATAARLDDEAREMMILAGADPEGARDPGACPRCMDSGYRGRVAVHEVMPIGGALSEAIASQAPVEHVRQLARQAGYRPMLADALYRVAAGETSIAEVKRMISWDRAELDAGADRGLSGGDGLSIAA